MSCDTDHSPNFYDFWGLEMPKINFWRNFWEKEKTMRPKNFKGGRCIKSKLKKCDEVARTYDKIQTAYAEVLDRDKNIEKIKCNVLLENLEDGEFTTDFLCTKTNGDLMVRECVFRKKLSLPRTCKLLDASRKYWARRGITDWAIVVEEGESADEEE
ncbi:hypothetical protein [Parabacteroides johnsonii]|jgi:hypothetical protein|uniref:hypothetical protein n=1 Tax=Parabacteroides johnsonii TaxID=387661 RepID=UPI00242E15C8|nr:hypothetical protein [Parabacteroides johnsonii]